MKLIVFGYIALILVLCTLLFLLLKRKLKIHAAEGDKGLEQYIRKAIKKGHLEMNIKQALQQQGWPQKLVDMIFEKIKAEPEKKLFGLPTGKIIRQEDKLSNQMQQLLDQQKILKMRIDIIFAKYYELKKKEEEFLAAKSDFTKQRRSPQKVSSEEMRKLLVMMDELLGKLPETEVDKFSRSKEFQTYKQALEEAKNTKEPDEKEESVQKVIKLIEQGKISEEKAREMLGLPKRIPKIAKLIQIPKVKEISKEHKESILKKFFAKKEIKQNPKLARVIKQALKKGYSEKEIIGGLKKRGWSADEVHKNLMVLKR